MIFNKTGLTNDSIILDIDTSNILSYDNNTGLTTTSLTFWDNYRMSDLTLSGYGQTMYDFGLATSFTEEKQYYFSENLLKFYRIGYNDPSGNTTYPEIIINTGTTEGTSFTLSGGYLTSFFKLPEKQFQLSKFRFENGFTIDTWINISQETFDKITSYTEGVFLYFGTKSENKFNVFYSSLTEFSSITYDTNNYISDLEYNAFCFKFNKNKTISLRYLGVSGLTTEYKSDNIINTTGWTNITITFDYCEKIQKDEETDSSENILLECKNRRDGNLNIFLNGKPFFEKKNIEEFFWLRDLETNPDKQIGLPYTINWGGGSTGLKNAYNYSTITYTSITDSITSFTYSDNLIDLNNITSDTFNSVFTSTTEYTYTGGNTYKLYNSDITGFTFSSNTNSIFQFTPVIISANTEYIYSGYLFVLSGYSSNLENDIRLSFQPVLDTEINIITSVTYNSGSTSSWNKLELVFRTPTAITGNTTYIPNLQIFNESGITNDYNFYFSDFSLVIPNVITTDTITTLTRNDLINLPYKSIVKENFDGSFYGGIQQLKIYERSLDFLEVKRNYNYFSTKYGFTKIK